MSVAGAGYTFGQDISEQFLDVHCVDFTFRDGHNEFLHVSAVVWGLLRNEQGDERTLQIWLLGGQNSTL